METNELFEKLGEKNRFICPLMSVLTVASEKNFNLVKCLQDKCQWWDRAENDCCIKSVSIQLIKMLERR